MSTLPATLADAVRAYAHHTQRGFTFVRTDGTERHYPFQEIHAEATRRGAFLRELGLKKGDRVGFVLPEPEEFVLSFLAATNAGMVPVPMYPQLSFKNVDSYHETVGHILKASGARVLLTGKSTYEFVAPVKEKHLTNMRSSSSDGVVQITPPFIFSLEECLDFLENDELLEVTPKHLRLRKRELDPGKRKRQKSQNN